MSDRVVAIKSSNGFFLCAEGGGGGALHANRPAQGPWERFTIINITRRTNTDDDKLMSGDKVGLRTDNNHFVVAEDGGGRETNANRKELKGWETFTIVLLVKTPVGFFPAEDEVPIPKVSFSSEVELPVAFMAENGNFMVAEGGGGGAVNANRTGLGPWERFTLTYAR